MMRKKVSKWIAICLAMAMMIGIEPIQAASTDQSKSETEQPGGSVATSGSATSGSAVSSPTPTAMATATATTSATPNLSAYKPAATTVTARGGSSRVRVTWSKVTDASGYYIYARQSGDGEEWKHRGVSA